MDMLTVTSLPSGPLVAAPSAPEATAAATLFDRAAEQSRSDMRGNGIDQIAETMLDRLDGFIDRTETFGHRADAIGRAGATAPPGDDKMGQAMQSLQQMFDRSIETQLVVRATTQLSGAANTLVRGQ